MIQDKGPHYNIGYGLTSRDVEGGSNIRQGANPDSGVFAKAFHDHPIAKFLAVAGVTMVGVHLGGKIVRDGGIKLADRLFMDAATGMPKTQFTHLVDDFRNLQRTLDDWEGVYRGPNGVKIPFQNIAQDLTPGEKRKLAEGAASGGEDLFRRQLQTRLVSQARRLPYELPAAYMVQKMPGLGTDSLFGSDKENQVNWYNPVDVIGDFTRTSLTNTVGMLIPMETGPGLLKDGWRRMLTYADGVASPEMRQLGVNLDMSLRRVGHSASDILNNAVRFSSKSSSAFSAGIHDAVSKTRPTTQVLRDQATSTQAKWRAARARGQSIGGFIRQDLFDLDSLDILTPAAGARDFYSGFKSKWSSMGEEYAHLDAMRAGKKTFDFNGVNIKVDPSKAYRVTPQNSLIEQIAYAVRNYGGPKGGEASISDLRGHEFYRQQMNMEYRRNLTRSVQQITGLDESEVRQVVDKLTIKRRPMPDDAGKSIPMSNRIAFGDIMGEWDSAFTKRLGDALQGVSPHGRVIADALGRKTGTNAMDSADRMFIENMEKIESRILDRWRTTYRRGILPFSRDRIGTAKLPYESFGRPDDPDTLDYLIRNTANRINQMSAEQGVLKVDPRTGKRITPIAIVRGPGIAEGTKLPVGDIANDLRRYGFDPSDSKALRKFLVDQKVIGKPGTRGFNFFGLRKLTVEDALNRNYFHPEIGGNIEGLIKDMSLTNPLATSEMLRKTPVGSVWESKTGQILDFSPLSRSFRKFMDTFAEQFQIPLIHIKPLPLLGYKAGQEVAQSPIIQIAAGDSFQPFIGGEKLAGQSEAWLFAKHGRAKGRLLRLYSQEDNAANTMVEEMKGFYKSLPTDPDSMLGRTARFAIRSKGQSPDEPRTGWRKFFSVDEDQPESFRGVTKRLKQGRTWKEVFTGTPSEDIDNPSVLARKILDGSVDDLLTTDADKYRVAKAFAALEKTLRIHSFDQRSITQILKSADEIITNPSSTPEMIQKAESIKKAFSFEVKDSVTGAVTSRPITSVGSRQDYMDAAGAIRRSIGESPLTDEQRQRLDWAYKTFVRPHETAARGFEGYFEGEASSQALRRKGISRRLDEAKMDLNRFTAIREAIERAPNATDPEKSFSELASDIVDQMEQLKRLHKVSSSDVTEARAALLSMQVNYDNIQGFKQSRVRRDAILSAMNNARDITNASSPSRAALADIRDHNMEVGGLGFLKRAAANMTGGITPYGYAGTEFNPFGGNQDRVFAKTFGTTFGDSKLKSVASVLGINTWSNPEAFSMSSVPVSHGFQRLNSFFGAAGLGLDETDFKGPLDFYARGIVGKRILPAFAAGTVLMTADRTAGGYARPKDENGNRVYAPLVLGGLGRVGVEAQAGLAGLIPGGQTGNEKREELLHGEVPIRKGRWWPIGNTPWKGGKIQYYRPSWYRRLESGYTYTNDSFGSPMERLAFGYDFSPLRPLDPYHYERKHLTDRPYPVSGEYFTGPWGPLTDFANMTVGKVIKPERKMHEKEVNWKLQQYQTVGQSGIAAPPTNVYYQDPNAAPGYPVAPGAAFVGGGGPSGGGVAVAGYPGGGGFTGTSPTTNRAIGAIPAVGFSGSSVARRTIDAQNARLIAAASGPPAYQTSPYGLATGPGFAPRVIYGGDPLSPNKIKVQGSSLGYRAQELMGIYGFTFGAVREGLGIGNHDMSPQRPVLASPNKAYGVSRSFWDLNLGGLGDAPTPFEGDFANIELSEIVRRFVSRERSDINYLNPITNDLARQYPWLPGAGNTINFKEGDPFAAVPMGEARLPGVAYERFNTLHPDMSGRYGALDQYKILGDIAPWSQEFKALDRSIDQYANTPEARDLIDTVRQQRFEKSKDHDFSEYEYAGKDYAKTRATLGKQVAPGVFNVKGFSKPISLAGISVKNSESAMNYLSQLQGEHVTLAFDKDRPPLANDPNATIPVALMSGGNNINQSLVHSGYAVETEDGSGLRRYGTEGPVKRGLRAAWEHISHRDTYLNTKFLPERTAVEEWERQNVYGATFPQWQHPIDDFLKPMGYKATTRGPILSMFALGGIGRLFGASAHARTVGTLIGAAAGLALGSMKSSEEFVSGERYLPINRRKEIAVEEYADILEYVKNKKLENEAQQMGDMQAASEFSRRAGSTMYGMDVSGDPNNFAAAVPDRKREYFRAFLHAPKKDRQRILSTAGRLERRLLEAAWGSKKIEARPDLVQYFGQHELPGEDWQGWQPDVQMDNVKVKVAQNMGLDVAQMGYYPQQIAAANAVNLPYPDLRMGSSKKSVEAQLQFLLASRGVRGTVHSMPNNRGYNTVNFNAGVAA